MTSTFRQRLLTSTMLIGAAAIASPAWAQSVDDQTVSQPSPETMQDDVPVESTPTESRLEEPATGETRQEVIVTGSRISRRDLDTTAPVAVVQDEEFQLSGATNVEQVINTLPQVVPGSTAFNNNPGGGVATLQLRGLGAGRTAVLVNGRRWMFFDTTQIVDLNTIPTFLIDSVDVVTGGASAVYGSDAMAGVVNFRLRTDLDGIEAGTHYAITQEGDGPRYGAHVALGANFDDGRGNVTAFAEYYKRGDIFQGDREFSAEALGDGDGELIGLGSSTNVFARIFDPFGNTGGALPASGGIVFPGEGVNQSRPFSGATDFYNYAPANYLMVPQQRWLLGAYGQYEISRHFQPYAEVSFVNNRVANELAASPVTGFFNIDADTACEFLTAEDCTTFQNAAAATGDPDIIESVFIQRRVIETGPRNALDERNAYRVLGGMTGEINDWMNYDSYYFYARTRNGQNQSGNVSRSSFQAGLDGTGTPINIFGRGTLTPAMTAAFTVPVQNTDISELQVAQASINGSKGNFGWGGDDFGFALGAEWRRVDSEFIADAAFNVPGEIIGFNAVPGLGGGYSVVEGFGELRLPIAGNMPGIFDLELWGAARYSDYSLEAVGGVWTYALGAQYAPIRDLRFRGQYQRAIRAPNVAALFSGQSPGFPPANDPCANPSAETSQAVCLATGVPAARFGDPTLQLNPQIEGLFGGNPNLQEETADSWTVGAVFSPSFIPRLNMTLDYYNIVVADAIGTFGGGLNNVLNLCYNVIKDPNSPYCQAINRDPAGMLSGDSFVVSVLNANIAELTAKGFDFQLDYSHPLNFSMMGEGRSRLTFFFLGNHTTEANFTAVQDLPEEITECAGKFGNLCGEPTPAWKWTSRLTFIDGPLTLSGRWRHMSAVKDDDPDTDYVVERLGARNYFDLTTAWDIGDHLRLTAGVNNIFNKKPPIAGDNQEQANTWPNTYDVLGRDYFVSALLRF